MHNSLVSINYDLRALASVYTIIRNGTRERRSSVLTSLSPARLSSNNVSLRLKVLIIIVFYIPNVLFFSRRSIELNNQFISQGSKFTANQTQTLLERLTVSGPLECAQRIEKHISNFENMTKSMTNSKKLRKRRQSALHGGFVSCSIDVLCHCQLQLVSLE